MFRIQLQILALLSFFFLNYSILTFAGNLPNPNTPVDNIANPEFVPSTIKQPKFGLAFGRRNAIATGLIIVITLLDIAVYKLRQIQEANIGEILNIPPSLLSSEKLCRRFSLADILSATHNFDDELIVGRGGFGKVYRGVINNGAISVAVKRLSPMSKQGAPQFSKEIELLSKFRHSNLVSLIGYCIDCNEMILVYEYMVHGALSDHLYKIGRNDVTNSTLCWVQRLKICIGAARGLDYLHTGTGVKQRVIHRDIKSSNILLDENWAAKISDFGLSKIGPANQSRTDVSTNIKGTFGYLDPEYLRTHKLTRKSDVYAFGIVLFEVLCGRRAVDLIFHEYQCGLAGWAQHYIKKGTLDQIIDPNLRQILPNSLKVFVQIADQCLHYQSKKRPTMAEVVASLESALALQERNDSSMFDGDIFNIGIDGADDNQEKADYSIEQKKVINVDHGGRHGNQIHKIVQLGDASSRKSRVKPGRMIHKIVQLVDASSMKSRVKPDRMMAFTRMVRSFLVGKAQVSSAEEDSEIHLGQLKRFPLHELKVATDNFNNKNYLGRGGFGKVYKGRLADGSLVAVKRLTEERTQGGERQFQTEVEMMSMVVHPNLRRLQGICMTSTERLLVYPYMANGSVASCLRDRPELQAPLDWLKRKAIALGSARGLAYLHDHCDPKIIHRDVKAANILLDDEFEAVVGGFWLAKLVDYEDTHVTTAVCGTPGYIAPEYLSTGKCSEKTDVFGYGVMLLELITGQEAFDLVRLAIDYNVTLLDWVEGHLKERRLESLVDEDLQCNNDDEEVEHLIQVALLCMQGSPMERPKMSDVVRILEGDGLAKRWEEWQKDEVFRQVVEDSNWNLCPDELSGPR